MKQETVPAEYHPELWGRNKECKEARVTVDSYREALKRVGEIVDNPELSRSQIKQRLAQAMVDMQDYLTSRPHTILDGDF